MKIVSLNTAEKLTCGLFSKTETQATIYLVIQQSLWREWLMGRLAQEKSFCLGSFFVDHRLQLALWCLGLPQSVSADLMLYKLAVCLINSPIRDPKHGCHGSRQIMHAEHRPLCSWVTHLHIGAHMFMCEVLRRDFSKETLDASACRGIDAG